MQTARTHRWVHEIDFFGWFGIVPCGAGSDFCTSPPTGTFYMEGTAPSGDRARGVEVIRVQPSAQSISVHQ